MSIENCDGCKFYAYEPAFRTIDKTFACHRNPQPIPKEATDWCGEFKSRDEGPKVTKLGQEPLEFRTQIDRQAEVYLLSHQLVLMTPSQRAILKRIKNALKNSESLCPQVVMAFTRSEVESIGEV
jgi:hypothetical protein